MSQDRLILSELGQATKHIEIGQYEEAEKHIETALTSLRTRNG